MDPAERFLRFAAECEFMAKFTRNPENRLVWARMAERWIRCARLYGDNAILHAGGSAPRRRTPAPSLAH
jgi:hypothetical protein